ncbi:hypothetical protein RHMOL_Rhmol06G0047500 [Rhododendron molle]|uniref:Uncharacterized protein n=2 Tax=Rhododendron molle TaxID=49168 RepID=A0ACC0NA38_RHOML|nr:hypothetical protein RHMOL_Rhmol06G0047500 [Rhododendron molle]KAI8549724.1 hypothetical protein RHMOL_Rhmol06G0047500 [Rhododendron molle]
MPMSADGYGSRCSNMEVENGYGFSLAPFLRPTSKTFTLYGTLEESDIRVMIRDERDINIPHLRDDVFVSGAPTTLDYIQDSSLPLLSQSQQKSDFVTAARFTPIGQGRFQERAITQSDG